MGGRGRGGMGGGGSRRWTLPPRPANSYRPNIDRSPSPDTGLLEAATREAKERERRNGRARGGGESLGMGKGKERERDEGLRVQHMDAVRDDDVRAFMSQFAYERILREDDGFYVTFKDSTTARRAELVVTTGRQMLGFHTVTVTVHPPPRSSPGGGKIAWDDKALVEKAQEMVERELREFLEKDITDRLVGPHLRRLAAERRSRPPPKEGEVRDGVDGGRPAAVKRDLKSMSFKKARKEVEVELPPEEHEEEREEEQVVVERPKKKRKKEVVKKKPKKVLDEDIESEDEMEPHEVVVGLKRSGTEEPENQPSPKKVKVEIEPMDLIVGKKAPLKKKKVPEKKRKPSVEEVILPDEYELPPVADLRLSSGFESSLSPSRSPSPSPTTPRLPTPPPNVFDEGICEDDEDTYYAKLVLSGLEIEPNLDPLPPPQSETAPFFRKHITGSARTEGFYKITHAEKIAYVTQYQARATNVAAATPVDEPPPQHVESSRSNRANARRRAQGLEEINQVQRAVALSKGEAAANEVSFKFNQLQTRKKHLRFARSPIHDWGLYAMEKISRGEMVAEKREKLYERQGIGSSYLFRIDEDLVVDATKKGNLGRLINHSCDPNCTAKIITINGEKKIVIYAKQEIELGDEITYDYHFPFEQDKIPCLCGSAKCRGFLN
ncbi:hypothetical protein R3P38DRAFT_3318722 [Favolaschia claudopus]|uniref:Histone-lysine N-methyltransferase, H3 lysine-4 specific n=1 Tax=Favolaschia claudopus TaxID=2862362 RepID=A0AAW0B3D0_9AGAR